MTTTIWCSTRESVRIAESTISARSSKAFGAPTYNCKTHDYGFSFARRKADDDAEVETGVNESSGRRAEILHSTIETIAADKRNGDKAMEWLLDDWTEDQLEDERMRGDIARAMVEVETREEETGATEQ